VQEFLHVGLPKLLFIALYAWALILLVNFITTRVIKVAERRDTLGVARGAQIRTLATVIRATGIVIVAFLAFLQIMENVLHFNLGPFLASAGVAGVAIGLASQTIVKDVPERHPDPDGRPVQRGRRGHPGGDDRHSDSMTLRKTTVRGFDGTIYIIPNSQITNVANQSRDYSVATLNVSVDFSANPDQVIPLLKKIALEVRNEPAFKGCFIGDPQVFGVDSIKGTEVILSDPDQDAGAQTIRRDARDAEAHPPGAGRSTTCSPAARIGSSAAQGNPRPQPGMARRRKPPTPPPPSPTRTNPFTGEGA